MIGARPLALPGVTTSTLTLSLGPARARRGGDLEVSCRCPLLFGVAGVGVAHFAGLDWVRGRLFARLDLR